MHEGGTNDATSIVKAVPASSPERWPHASGRSAHPRADRGRGAGRGGIRTGLEDTPVLPDGRLADGNGDLVAAAAAMLADSAPE